MIGLQIILDTDAATAFVETHDLVFDSAPLEVVIIQEGATSGGLPAVLLIATIDGRKRVIKTSLRVLLAASSALNAHTEMKLGPDWRGP